MDSLEDKKCSVCGVTKTVTEFYSNRRGVHAKCKPCYIECNKEYQKKYRDKNRFAVRLRSCRHRALEKDLDFNLTEDHLKEIWTGICPVFKTTLDMSALKGEAGHAQLDRIEPSKGYTIGNVVWLSQRANRIKNDATLEDLERLVEWLKSQLNT